MESTHRRTYQKKQSCSLTRNGVFLVTTLFLWKFCFNLEASHKELIWCTNCPNVLIDTCSDFSHMFTQYNMFFMWVTRNIERFQYFNFETNFLKNEKLFQNTGVPIFSWKYKDQKSNISNISKSNKQQNCPVRSHC